ncbi:carbohydrate ABC transporter permease [Symbiobacterium thermophilum]|uniref:carbohydrate ABC transporter permease n=1 Tax=Symbiobacterium thermophilum TaxID=2734 RepID=UPI00235684F3|nr:carbohydrate ABC transporter permease [Symbiobacterium thermophilum]
MSPLARRLGDWSRALVGVFAALIFVVPFYWMLVTSLKAPGTTTTFPPQFIPRPATLESYREAFASIPLVRYFLNSVIVTGSVLALQLPLVTAAAYAFANFDFKFKNQLFTLCLMSMMIPAQVTFLPNFLLMNKLRWYDTYLALIIPFASSAYGIFLLRQAFLQVPKDLIHAAELDGANHFQVLWHVLVPIVKPTITTVALFAFVTHWNSYFWPLVVTNSDAVRTLPVGVAMLRDGENRMSWSVLMAGNMVAVTPVLALFLIFQKNLVRSFVQGGLKS